MAAPFSLTKAITMISRLTSTAALLAAITATHATAGTIALETAGIAADLDNQRGSGTLESLIGVDSPFSAVDVLGDGTTQADLVFGDSSRFAQASIDARTVFDNTLDVSGTSRNTEPDGETFHLVELGVTLSAGESFVATAHNIGDGVNDFDRAFLSSVQVFDAAGEAVDADSLQLDLDGASPSVSLAPGAGTFSVIFSAASPSPVGDDEFAVRFSTVVGAPSPTAAAAGLLGLVALGARRRRNG